MKFVIFGAGGRVGQNVVLQALDAGHEVKAYLRDMDAILIRNPKLEIIQGNALNAEDVYAAIAGADVVISVLGTKVLNKPISLMSDAMRHIITGMQKHNVARVLAVGGAGILMQDAQTMRKDHPKFPEELKYVSEDHYRVYQQLAHSGLQWTMACPPWMPSDEATKQYRVLDEQLPDGAEKVSAADCAHFLVTEAVENKHLGKRVGIAY